MGLTVNPISSKIFNSSLQIDLIDNQSNIRTLVNV